MKHPLAIGVFLAALTTGATDDFYPTYIDFQNTFVWDAHGPIARRTTPERFRCPKTIIGASWAEVYRAEVAGPLGVQ
jgi:hypothetical protein